MTLIRSLSHYIECVEQQLTAWQAATQGPIEPVFRGQANADWELVPALLRSGRYARATEDRLLREFQRGARPFLRQPPMGRLQWMALGQHHGLPTRLLDWSESALVALFFAMQEHHQIDGSPRVECTEDACVWMLNRARLHARYSLPEQVVLIDAAEREWPGDLRALIEAECDGVLVFATAHVSARMPVQKATFTLFGPQANELERLRDDPMLLRQYRIPRRLVPMLSHALELAGITRSTLFPDLDGVAGEVWDRELRRRAQRA
jgi:hypothetical protein